MAPTIGCTMELNLGHCSASLRLLTWENPPSNLQVAALNGLLALHGMRCERDRSSNLTITGDSIGYADLDETKLALFYGAFAVSLGMTSLRYERTDSRAYIVGPDGKGWCQFDGYLTYSGPDDLEGLPAY